MGESILIGGGFALAAALQPGPLQAFLFARVAQKGWKHTLPAAFSPLLSDGPIALLVLLVLNRMPATLGRGLQAAGGVFLLYLAWRSYRQWHRNETTRSGNEGSSPRTLVQAALVNLLNPNPYLGWSLVLGPAFLAAWHQRPPNAVALIVAFYSTLVLSLAFTILIFGATRWLGPRGRRTLVLVSTLTLAVLGVYQLTTSFWKSNVRQPATPTVQVGAEIYASDTLPLFGAVQRQAATCFWCPARSSFPRMSARCEWR